MSAWLTVLALQSCIVELSSMQQCAWRSTFTLTHIQFVHVMYCIFLCDIPYHAISNFITMSPAMAPRYVCTHTHYHCICKRALNLCHECTYAKANSNTYYAQLVTYKTVHVNTLGETFT